MSMTKQQMEFRRRLLGTDKPMSVSEGMRRIRRRSESRRSTKKEVEQPKPQDELEYILEHADTKEGLKVRHAIDSKKPEILRNIEFGYTVEKAYESMDEREKTEYGKKYTPFKDRPVQEWRQYHGGAEYTKGLSEHEKQVLINQYIKQFGGLDKYKQSFSSAEVIEIAQKYASAGGIFGGEIDREFWRSYAFEQLTMSPTERKDLYFSSLPLPVSAYTSFHKAGIGMALLPVTLPQTIVKYGTGTGSLLDPIGRISTGKTILPDVALEMQKVTSPSPSGLIGVGISEGLGLLTGRHVGEWDRASKYPVETAFGTVGEVFGLLVGHTALKYSLSKLKTSTIDVTKSIVVKTPKYYYKVTQELGLPKSIRNIVYEHHGGWVQRSWQRLHSYSLGEMKFVKVFKQKGVPNILRSSRGMGSGRIATTKWAGFGRRELVPTNVYNLAQERMSSVGTFYVRGVTGTPKSQWNYVFSTDRIKIKGLIYKRITETKASLRMSPVQPVDKGFDGFVNPLTVKGGYTLPKGYKPLGSYYKSGESLAKIKNPRFTGYIDLLPDETATMSLVSPQRSVTIPSTIGRGGGLGYASLLNTLNLPASSLTNIGILSASLTGVGTITYEILKTDRLTRETRKTKSGLKNENLTLSLTDVESLTGQISQTEQLQLQKQDQSLKLQLSTDIKTPSLSTGRRTPPPPSTNLFANAKLIILPFSDDELTGKSRRKMSLQMPDVGYRERDWHVKDIGSMLKMGSLDKEMKKLMKGVKL